MSFFSNNVLINIEKPQIKIKNKPKKIIPSKPNCLIPSSTYKNIKERESQLLKKETMNRFNNHSLNINIRAPIRNRNIYSQDMSLMNSTLNNSIKNVHILLKNNNNIDCRSIVNMNNNIFIGNNSIKNFYNFYDSNENNKENLINKVNSNYIIKNDKTIIVNKANKFIKDNKIINRIYKKINFKQKPHRRTLSINKINNNNDKNNNDKNNNNNNNNDNMNKNIKKNIINDNNSNNNNFNNSLLIDLISNHKKNNSISTNIYEKTISLKKKSQEKLKASRSFSNSVEKKNIIIKNKKLSKKNKDHKKILYSENIRNTFNNTTNHFYSRLKHIIPYSNNHKIKLTNINSNIKSPEISNNTLNKSFTTNNFIKKFNLSKNDKGKKNDYENNNKLNTIEHPENNRKTKDYLTYVKTNNNLITNIISNNTKKIRKKFKTKSISNLSNLDIQILNKSRDSILNHKNSSMLESEKEPKKIVNKKILKIDSCTIPGYSLNGVKQKNQDSFFLKKNFLSKEEQFFIGICDGHGSFGDLVSQYISETLPLYVKNTSKEELIKAYIDTNNALINNSKIDCSLSGTTCTSLIITLDKITCANIGNTRAILAKFENGCYNTVSLSRDHKPTESEEIKRILSEGGVIKQLYDKNKKEYYGPERIWLKNSDIPGLSMSRSFGDNLAHTVGVNNIPEVRSFDYTGGEKFIVIASDSIWQYIDSDECVRIIKDYYERNMDAVGALNSLVTEAIKRWKKQENKIEDITAVVIFFE